MIAARKASGTAAKRKAEAILARVIEIRCIDRLLQLIALFYLLKRPFLR
ncbi:MAG: hypothetical protein USCAAHI_00479 [Beijerinckiaceae bacterium]|nr:MAG: hypothetical protein USCAAHI_00479 [Beijerinckiaceae bacterium]